MNPLLASLLLSASLSAVSLSAFSQAEFKNGFIIDADKKYVYGYVSMTELPHLACHFKVRVDGPVTTYSVREIQGYGVINGIHYHKKPIILDGHSAPDEIFMEVVADGTITLYAALGRMFIQRGDQLYELTDNQESLSDHRARLTSMMNGNPGIEKRIRNISLTRATIKSLVEDYNAWATGRREPAPKTKMTKEIGVFAGIDRTKFSTGPDGFYIEEKRFTDRTLAAGGIHLKLRPGRSKHLALATGLWFNDQRFYASGVQSAGGGFYQRQTVRVNYQALRLPLLLEVGNPTASKIQPYLKAGLSIPMTLSHEISIIREIESGDVIYIDSYGNGALFKAPLLKHISAGVSIPVRERISAYCEAFYSGGKNSITLDTIQKKTITGRFRSYAFNLGLTFRL